MGGEWSWRAAESGHHGWQTFELTRGGAHVGTLEMRGSIPQPSLVLGALCDALAGPAVADGKAGGAASMSAGDSRLEDAPPAPDRPLTGKQRGKIHVGLAELGYRDRDRRLVAISGIVGRKIKTSNELTSSEASAVIDRVDAALRKRHRDGAA